MSGLAKSARAILLKAAIGGCVASSFWMPDTYSQTGSPQPTISAVSDARTGPIKVNTDLITFNVVVTDTKGQTISGLPLEAFEILDNKVPQRITYFSDTDAPASIGIILDTSSSMSG